jgi:pimeloyl-ACP methyl ester carboxylesterase
MRAGTLQVNGGSVETGWWGPDPAEVPTLVLLHEGLGSVALWRDAPERLAAVTGWGVFAYSRFGYGNSDTTPLPRPMTYMHHEAQVVLPEVLCATGIQRAVLIGHSDGGSIAAIYAGTSGLSSTGISDPPEHTSCQEVSHPSGHTPRPRGSDHTCGPKAISLLGLVTIAAHFFVEDLNIASIRQIGVTYDTGDLRQRLARYHRDVEVAFRGWNGAWLDPRFRDFNITGFLRAIQVPILALQGADDPYGTDEQLTIFAANVRVPIQTRLIPCAKHSPHLEAKDATLAAICSFIADLQRGFLT